MIIAYFAAFHVIGLDTIETALLQLLDLCWHGDVVAKDRMIAPNPTVVQNGVLLLENLERL
jgi:hypothetical protein